MIQHLAAARFTAAVDGLETADAALLRNGRSYVQLGVCALGSEHDKMNLMALKKERADFPRSVKLTVAKRAAYRCGFPDCDRVTTGPGANDDQSATTGVAAHIYSAREGGPRGCGGLSFEQRQSVDNAIWLCADHAARIDKNNGLEFPAPTLKAYKCMHEQKIRRERDGTGVKIGWIHALALDQVPVFYTPAEIEFGKVTILHGDNESGKTALCDWIQGMSDPDTLCGWADPKRPALSFEVTYLDPSKQKVRVRVQSRDEIEYFVNGKPTPFNPNPIKFVRLRDLRLSCLSDDLPPMTDLEFLSKTLSVNPAIVRNMLPLVGTQGADTILGLRLEHDHDGSVRVWANVQGTLPGLSLQHQLSSSERSRVLVEIAAVFARHSAKRVPTVLLLDWAAKSFDSQWMSRLVEFLSSEENPFQTIIERVTGLGGHAAARVVTLYGKRAGVTIRSLQSQ